MQSGRQGRLLRCRRGTLPRTTLGKKSTRHTRQLTNSRVCKSHGPDSASAITLNGGGGEAAATVAFPPLLLPLPPLLLLLLGAVARWGIR
mgnify:CR=1 FL=1